MLDLYRKYSLKNNTKNFSEYYNIFYINIQEKMLSLIFNFLFHVSCVIESTSVSSRQTADI